MDPEFLAALPEELQQEVLESRRREIRARRSARERAEAQRVRHRPALTKAIALRSCPCCAPSLPQSSLNDEDRPGAIKAFL